MAWTDSNPVVQGNPTKKSDYDALWDNVTSLHLFLNASEYASINAAVTAIGATKATLIVSNDQTLAANLTIPSTLTLKILSGGSITKASTYTLTVNGSFEAGVYKVFYGFSAGDITGLREPKPEWWGAVNDADCTTAITCAAQASPGGRLPLPPFTSYISSSVTWPRGVHPYGAGGTEETKIKATNTFNIGDPMFIMDAYFEIDHVRLDGSSRASGIDCDVNEGVIRNSHVNSMNGYGIKDIYNAVLDRVSFWTYTNATDIGLIPAAGSGLRVNHCFFETQAIGIGLVDNCEVSVDDETSFGDNVVGIDIPKGSYNVKIGKAYFEGNFESPMIPIRTGNSGSGTGMVVFVEGADFALSGNDDFTLDFCDILVFRNNILNKDVTIGTSVAAAHIGANYLMNGATITNNAVRSLEHNVDVGVWNFRPVTDVNFNMASDGSGGAVLTFSTDAGAYILLKLIADIPTYADNAAAKTGGLVDGQIYRTATGTI
ncbi:MAG: hypothetical protein PHN75_17755, partial [Syntrophales bacterium]|nr:hypothetical protein [Syntrophales bacterium]